MKPVLSIVSASILLVVVSMLFSIHQGNAYAFDHPKSVHCGQFLATQYTVDDGLPTNLTKDILQDAQGFVWIATDAGLVRFDGFRFLTVQHHLPSLYVKRVFLRRSGQLLALTDMGLVAVRSLRDSIIITPILGGSQTEQPNLLHYAKSLYEDSHGALWFSEQQAVVRWYKGVLKRYSFPEKCNSTSMIVSFAFAEDNAGHLIVSSYQGFVFSYNAERDSFDEISLLNASALISTPPSASSSAPSPSLAPAYGSISQCLSIRAGEFLLAAEKGIISISFSSLSTAPLVQYKPVVNGVNRISAIYMPPQPQKSSVPTLFIGTWYEGVLVSDTALTTIHRIQNLEPQRIKNFCADAVGNVWVCGDQGILLLEHALMRYTEGFDIAIADVGVVVQSPSGVIYTISGEDVYVVHPHEVRSRRVWNKPPEAERLYALYADNANGVWAGALSGNLSYWRNGAVLRSYTINNGSSERGIFSLAADKGGNLWGCVYSQRLSVFCLQTNGRIRYYGVEHGVVGIAQIVRISAEGQVFVGASGTPDAYIFRYNPETDRFDNVSPPVKNKGNFRLNVYDLSFDPIRKRRIWLASSLGLMQIDNIAPFSSAMPLDSAALCFPLQSNPEFKHTAGKAIAVDNKGTVWMGTDNGIVRYFPERKDNDSSNNAAILHQASGLRLRTISYRGLLFDADGHLWVATTNGLYKFHAPSPLRETPKPDLLQVDVNGGRIENIDSNDNNQETSLSFSAQSYIRFFFTVFVPSTHTVSFRSRLYPIGAPAPIWSRPYQDPTLALSNLEAGSYIVEIQARRDGLGELWSTPLSLHLRITPPWYRSWWAFLLYTLGGLLIAGTLTLVIVARRERRRLTLEQEAKERLQAMVEQRTREITMQKELLETQTLEIQSANAELRRANEELQRINAALKDANAFKTRMVSIVSHDLKNPLGSMLGLAKMLESSLQGEDERSMVCDIGELAGQTLNLVTDLLDSAAMETGKIELHTLTVDVSELVTAIVWQYRPLAAQKQQQIFLSIEADCTVEGDQRRLWQVFENLISNAVKYSPVGKSIWVSLEHCPHTTETGNDKTIMNTANTECVRFSVRDEGIGLTEEDKQKAFMHFQKLSAKPTGGESSSGVGLAIVKQITELHGGCVWVESIFGEGATFIVELPAIFRDNAAEQ